MPSVPLRSRTLGGMKSPVTSRTLDIEREPVLPLLYVRREYLAAEDGSTTTCRSTTTNPVPEYTPDD